MQKEPKIVIQRSSAGLMEKSVSKSVDTKGMACPYPSFEAVKNMSSLNANDILELITDSEESALESIPTVCEKRSWEFIVVEDGKDLWRVRIKK